MGIELITESKDHEGRTWVKPLLMATPPVLVLLLLAVMSFNYDKEHSVGQLNGASVHIGETIQLHLKAQADYLVLLAEEISFGHLDELLFQKKISKYVTDHPYLINVTWADKEFVIQTTAPYEPNKQVVGLKLSLPEPKRASRQAALTGRPIWTDPFEVIQGKAAIEVYVPIFKGDEFIGTLGGVHSIKGLFDEFISAKLRERYSFAITDSENRYFSMDSRMQLDDTDLIKTFRINLSGPRVTLVVTANESEKHWSQLSLIMLCICLIIGMAYSVMTLKQRLSEQRRAETALKESEKRATALLEANPDLVFRLNRQGVYLDYKGVKSEPQVQAPETIIGKNSHELLSPELADLIDEKLKLTLDSGEIQTFEYQMLIPDQGPIDFEARMVKSSDDEVIVIVRNVTERKQADETLRKQIEKYHGIFGESVATIYIFDNERYFVDSNQAGLDLLGYSREELLKISISDVGADLEVVLLAQYQLHAGSGLVNYEHRLIRKDGKVITVLHNSRPLTDAAGIVIGMQSTLIDITKRKQIEQALKIERDNLKSIFEVMSDGVYIVNQTFEIQYVNSVIKKEYGSFDGVKCHKYFHGFDEPCSFCKNDIVFAGETVHWEWTSSGNGKTYDLIDTPFITTDGSMSKLVLFRDITETKRLQKLEYRTGRLETAGIIAGQVAHDFNNLLAPMMAYPEFIREELPKDHPALEFLGQIEEATHKIADINQDLLAMGRRVHYNQVILNLNLIIENALSGLKPYPETLAFELVLCQELMDIKGGSAQLHRVVSNLLQNAKDAMHDHGKITIKTENFYLDDHSIDYDSIPRGEYVKLTITDTGCGIPDDNIQKIFDPFFTSKTTSKRRGSGLGMSVVDAVIKDHQGFIDLTTKVGVGTSFFIYLPITRQTIDAQKIDTDGGGQETLLIVDDDVIQREVSTRLLEKLGYKVSSIESGEKAIEYVREHPQDLIVLDMIMPNGIDGTETYRRMLEINPHQKVIILSGFSGSDRVIEAQKLGAGTFVKKPVTRKIIAAAVRAELDRKVEVINV